MKKLVDAAIVAALLMTSCPESLSSVLSVEQPPAITETAADATHGDRPC